MNRFAMNVQDVFRLEGKRTVLIGVIDGGGDPIPACPCELTAEKDDVQRLSIEGEMILEKQANTDSRAVSTVDEIEIDQLKLKAGKYRLAEIDG